MTTTDELVEETIREIDDTYGVSLGYKANNILRDLIQKATSVCRVNVDPDIAGGEPVLAGTRITMAQLHAEVMEHGIDAIEPTTVPCPECEGRGWFRQSLEHDHKTNCPTCKGTGRISREYAEALALAEWIETFGDDVAERILSRRSTIPSELRAEAARREEGRSEPSIRQKGNDNACDSG